MQAVPFVVATKFSVLQKLLEGDPQTLAIFAVALPFAAVVIWMASTARRKLNARRGRTLHGELEGSAYTEHSSGELIFELGYTYAGVKTVICGHQTSRKQEHTSFTLPLPAGWSEVQLLDGLQSASPAMAYFTVEGLDGAARFRCEGIGMPGQFFQQVMSQTAGLLQPSNF